MTFEELERLDQRYLMPTYRRFPVDLDHGEGATLYSMDGRAYIDFTSGIGVSCLGYGNESWADAVLDQAMKVSHISNLFYSQPCVLLAEQLCLRSGMEKAFFANSGAEANEAMIKLARKYSFDRFGIGRSTILTLHNSFHGRTITTLSATAQEGLHNYFFPFNSGFRYAKPTMEGVHAESGHDVCAVMLELVQGEGGVLPMKREFVHNLAVLCAEREWLLLVDEVQTGIGRTGSLFAYQQYGILPDVVSFAKGIAGGLPMGGILANNRCKDVLGPGTHGSTFGGNPISSSAALAVLDILDEHLLSQVREKGEYLRTGIEMLDLPELGEIRGMGLMIGIDVVGERSNRELASLLAENGLLVLTAGDSLRLMPPLTITKEELDKGLTILKQTLE